MSDDYRAESEEMQLLTADYVRELLKIWTHIFDGATCRENLRKLADHARHFYDELVAESKEKRTYIEQEITQLRDEAHTLRRLLNVEVRLPAETPDSPPPLLVLQDEMDNALTALREQLRERRAQICELLLQQEALCEELGTPPRALLDDPLPSAGELQDFAAHLAALREERVARLNRLSTLRREIKALQHALELGAQTQSEQRLLHQRDIKLSSDVFESLERLRTHYAQQQTEMREQIDAMRRKLAALWDRLGETPPAAADHECFSGGELRYNQRTYDLHYAELQRCEQLRSANIKRFVQQIRRELAEWWERTLKSPQERARFSHYNNNCYTDDLLLLHEMELDDLKQYFEKNRAIFQLYADRRMLWERMCALEAKASEPNRYNNRGGQLLKEERERKTIATKLPKIELEIRALVEEYEQRERAPFLVQGENILELMAGEWARKREEKELISSARKQAATPASASSHSRTQLGGGRTPMSTMKNASSVSNLRKTPSTSSLYGGGGAGAAVTSSALKRKLNTGDRHVTPVAKRSLMHALNSPSVFVKPGTSSTAAVANGHKRRFRSPRVVATTIRRKSGRLSASGANLKKRRSMNKSAAGCLKNAHATPKIVVHECTSSSDDGAGSSSGGGGVGATADDTYDSFEKCIESRSSILPTSSGAQANSSRVKRMRQIAANENERLAHLPKPQPQTPSRNRIPVRTRTPAKHVGGTDNHAASSSSVQSPGSSSRKLTTRNLPIII